VLHTLAEMIDWLDRHLAAGGVLEAGFGETPAAPEDGGQGG